MNKEYERLLLAKEEIRKITDFQPKIGLVLGSGLGQYANNMEIECEIPYSDIPGYPVSTVGGHDGKYIFGYIEGVPLVVMNGRVHYYEGYPIEDVVMPIRVMGLLGIETLILTNAAGGIDYNFHPGTLMMITDQITGYVPSPLIGPNIDELGTRFPDMSNIYDKEIREIIREVSEERGIELAEGVYIQFSGPQFESPAEIKAFRILGASAVGMSTACEAIAANHMGLKIAGISCITNMAAGMTEGKLTHEEVQEIADKVSKDFESLITGLIERLGTA